MSAEKLPSNPTVEKKPFGLLESLQTDLKTRVNRFLPIAPTETTPSEELPRSLSVEESEALARLENVYGVSAESAIDPILERLENAYDLSGNQDTPSTGTEMKAEVTENSDEKVKETKVKERNKKFGQTLIMIPGIFKTLGFKTTVEYPIFKARESMKNGLEKSADAIVDKSKESKDKIIKMSNFALNKFVTLKDNVNEKRASVKNSRELSRKELNRQTRGHSNAIKHYVDSKKVTV